jgi:hypothetical protein
MKKNMTRRNRTKIMPRKVGLAFPANVKLKLPNNLRIRRAHTKRKGVLLQMADIQIPYLLDWAPPPIKRRPRMSAAFEIIFFKECRLRMSAALNSVIIFRRQNGDILWQRHLKLVYFIVKSSWYNSQIKRRIWSSENLKSAAALKRVNTVQILYSTLPIRVFQWLVTYCYFRNTLSILTQVTLNMPSYSIKTQIGTKWNRNIKTQIGTSLLSKMSRSVVGP